MSVRQNPKNPACWIIDCRPDGYKGRRVRLEYLGSREGALKVERDLMRRVEIEVRPTARSMAGIWPEFVVWYRANRAARTAEDVERVWRNTLGEEFGRLQPKALTRASIEAYKARRLAAGVKPRTINKELSYFAKFVKWAAENDYCDPLPFVIRGYEKAKTRPPKPRPLTTGQIDAILAHLPDYHRLTFLLMADAGLRLSEALHLRREDVEFDHMMLFVIGKGSKERLVPIMTERLRVELLARKEVVGYLSINKVTGRPYTGIRDAMRTAAKVAGVEKHVYHHLLRHSFGTNTTIAGINMSSIQAMMGHSTPSTTNLYQNLAGEVLRNEGKKFGEMVLKTDRQCPHGHEKKDDKC